MQASLNTATAVLPDGAADSPELVGLEGWLRIKADGDLPGEVPVEENLETPDGRPDLGDPLQSYLRDMWNLPMMEHDELVSTCRRIEEAEEHLCRIVLGFGFAVKEYLQVAGLLLSDPPLERFERVVGGEKADDPDEHLGLLRRLVPKACVLDQEADHAFEGRSHAGNGHNGNGSLDAAALGIKLRTLLVQFGIRHEFTEKLAARAQDLEASARRELDSLGKLEAAPASGPCAAELAAVRERLGAIEREVRMPVVDFLLVCEQMKWFLNNAQQLKSSIVLANLRLVIYFAKRYARRGLPLIDLIQEGNIGLMKAVDRFEYRRGYKFFTYARWWIQHSIASSIANHSRTIRVPAENIPLVSRLIAERARLQEELGYEPSPEELAQQLQLPPARVRRLLHYAWAPVSLQSMAGDEDGELADFIPDPSAGDPASEIDEHLTNDRLRDVLGGLKERERRVLELRFGLNDHEPHTLDEVGQRYKLTRERIRQIEARALKKLRHPERARQLAGACG